ncbi:DUF4097 family beta strand repeat-containing protein [Paractinoplanes hotanensis]|uniref:DUF4097 domain-containing protein n=1 Tax=Paractinoplanes hotanensis TaxID=2906497 RepID=A0ABT0XVH5_9ACTN|nr:DUF4097 family beta strand repeat-containing protein [Actinoplanes hotanensis]MCM4077615.1 DUF4097 domain-containing protein [Actinoplanes hotanensis]
MYEFPHPQPVTVALHARNGVVRLHAEDRDDIQVTVEPMDGKDSGREAAESTPVLLEGDTLVIGERDTVSWSLRRTPKLAITARVPAGSSLAGKSASADVAATGPWQTVKLDVASADVQIDEIAGDAALDSASGDLSVSRVGGSLRIGAASGDIRVGDVTGDVSAKSASGDMRLDAVDGRLRVSTASGDVRIGRLREGRSEIKTASGDVQVGIEAGAGVWLDVSTASGRTITDLTQQGAAPPAADGPAVELTVRTASGDIHLHRATDRKVA